MKCTSRKNKIKDNSRISLNSRTVETLNLSNKNQITEYFLVRFIIKIVKRKEKFQQENVIPVL